MEHANLPLNNMYLYLMRNSLLMYNGPSAALSRRSNRRQTPPLLGPYALWSNSKHTRTMTNRELLFLQPIIKYPTETARMIGQVSSGSLFSHLFKKNGNLGLKRQDWGLLNPSIPWENKRVGTRGYRRESVCKGYVSPTQLLPPQLPELPDPRDPWWNDVACRAFNALTTCLFKFRQLHLLDNCKAKMTFYGL